MTQEKGGLLIPLRRDRKRDFAATDGAELIASKVRQVLATEGATPQSSGELPWRTGFGSAVHLLRHQRNDTVLAELAGVYVREALRRWLPRLTAVAVTVEQQDNKLLLTVRYRSDTGLASKVSVDVNRLMEGGEARAGE